MDTNLNATVELEKRTFILEHNPNCPSPYMVRLIAPGNGFLDKKLPDKTRDILGWGQSFEDAAGAALHKLQEAWAELTEKANKPV